MTQITVIGTLDTKFEELSFLKRELVRFGASVTTIDVSTTIAEHPAADISASEVAAAAGVPFDQLALGGDRASALETMSRGAGEVLRSRFRDGEVDGVIGIGGSGNTEVASRAMRCLPTGPPKVLLSTASVNVEAFVKSTDVTIIHSVTDVAGLNFMLRNQIAQAAAAVTAMTLANATPRAVPDKTVAVTMFGITTAGATVAIDRLRARGYEVLVFHANGSGGRALEHLIEDGQVQAVLDITTTELADELLGGFRSAGPNRPPAAGARGIPQVISVGALDIVNFNAVESVPPGFRGRRLYGHAATATLMRTNVAENHLLGRALAQKLNAATGPVVVMVPGRGFSALDERGQSFYDPEADQALVESLRTYLNPTVEFVEIDAHINDPSFATALADRLASLYEEFYVPAK